VEYKRLYASYTRAPDRNFNFGVPIGPGLPCRACVLTRREYDCHLLYKHEQALLKELTDNDFKRYQEEQQSLTVVLEDRREGEPFSLEVHSSRAGPFDAPSPSFRPRSPPPFGGKREDLIIAQEYYLSDEGFVCSIIRHRNFTSVRGPCGPSQRKLKRLARGVSLGLVPTRRLRSSSGENKCWNLRQRFESNLYTFDRLGKGKRYSSSTMARVATLFNDFWFAKPKPLEVMVEIPSWERISHQIDRHFFRNMPDG